MIHRRILFALTALVLVVVATLVITSPPAFGQNPTFTTPVNLSSTSTGGCQQQSSCQQTAAVGNYVYAVWDDDVVLGRPKAYFKSSSNNGTNFGSATILNSGTGWAQNPQVAASGSYVYVVWQDNSTGWFKLYLSVSTNNGASFNTAVNLGTSAHVNELGVQVIANANNVYVAWLENANPPTVSFRASIDHGSTFAAQKTLSGSAGNSFLPQLSLYGSSVYVVWRQNVASMNDDVFFDASGNNGTTFNPIINLSSNTGESFDPAIAAYANDVYVMWPDNTNLSPSSNYDMFFKVSTNRGGSFSSVSNLSGNTGTSLQPLLAAYGTSVYAIWQDATPGNPDILFQGSTNNATTFSATINLSNDPGTSKDPRAVALGSKLNVVWDDTTTTGGVDDVFFTSSDNNGLNFGSVLNLSNNAGFSTKPQVSASGSNVYVVYADDTSTAGFDDVYFTVGTPTVIIPPTVYSTGWAVPENTPMTITLIGSDPLGLPLTFSVTAGPTHGTLGSITSTGSTSAKVTYTPNPNYWGPDSFTFKANNGRIDSAPGTMTITVAVPSGGGHFVV